MWNRMMDYILNKLLSLSQSGKKMLNRNMFKIYVDKSSVSCYVYLNMSQISFPHGHEK